MKITDMVSIVASLLVFAGTVFVHILIHRYFVFRRGTATVKTIIVYPVSILVFGFISRSLPFPVTTLWFYTLLVVSYLLYYASHLSDGQSPSAKILQVVADHGSLSRQEIIARFTNYELLDKRISALIQTRLIEDVDGRYFVHGSGRIITAFFLLYRNLLQWDQGG